MKAQAVINFNIIEKQIINLRNIPVILDYDVAKIYGVETRDINKAVKNNPDKFPNNYIFVISKEELEFLRGNISTANLQNNISTTNLSKTRVLPKAFTEKGLYMLATILKSPQATQTTIQIIETFSKIKELGKNVKSLQTETDKQKQKSLTQRSGEIIADILDSGADDNESETTIELNLAVLKFKHTIKKNK
jgi:hypothetical protein